MTPHDIERPCGPRWQCESRVACSADSVGELPHVIHLTRRVLPTPTSRVPYRPRAIPRFIVPPPVRIHLLTDFVRSRNHPSSKEDGILERFLFVRSGASLAAFFDPVEMAKLEAYQPLDSVYATEPMDMASHTRT